MKITRLVVIAAMAGASLCAGQRATEQQITVTVCSESDPYVLRGVQALASEMFASIGVRIDWRDGRFCPAGVAAIQLHLSYNPSKFKLVSSAQPLAFAQLYQGTIVVFPDRVRKSGHSRRGGPYLMAHVLVHEITHVLEGIDRHSATGIMKARWDDDDYFAMCFKPLGFAQEDVDLVYAGLNMRQARLATARPATASLLTVARQ